MVLLKPALTQVSLTYNSRLLDIAMPYSIHILWISIERGEIVSFRESLKEKQSTGFQANIADRQIET